MIEVMLQVFHFNNFFCSLYSTAHLVHPVSFSQGSINSFVVQNKTKMREDVDCSRLKTFFKKFTFL